MSASIPIPGRRHEGQNPSTALQMQIGGMSLPATHRSFGNSPAKHRPIPLISQDDIATSWPPRPSVRLVSRSARKWLTGHRDVSDPALPYRTSPLEPWDFSEIASTSNEVMSAFEKGTARAERPPREGVCGTYFIRRIESKSSVLCVFKPVDEEAGDLERSPQVSLGFGRNSGDLFTLGPHHGHSSSHNSESPSDYSPSPPAGYAGLDLDHGSRSRKNDPGFLAGEGAYKEVAAYLLDHDRFARVPQTALAMCNFASELPERNKPTFEDLARSPSSGFGDDTSSSSGEEDDNPMRTKMGAFQVYVENVGDADDYGPGVFSKDQIHKIAVLDIRTLNHDRHGGNILVVKSSMAKPRFNLVPIDHGYILPDVVKSVPWPVWMDWSPIKEDISPEVRAYIARLDPAAEARSLSEELDGKLRMGSLRSLRIATTLLQKGVAAGLTLYEIGLLIYSRRDFPNVKSELERIIVEAEDAADTREHRFSEELSSAETSTDSGNANSYRSAGYMPSVLGKRLESQQCMDDYIVKYASRLISDTVRRVADNKAGAGGGVMSSSKPLGRARSIPDFGIGFRPLHAMADVFPRLETEDHTGPTPLSSPVDKDRANPIEKLVSSFAPTSKPIRFSIDSGSSLISLPPLPRNPSGVPQSTDSIPKPKQSRPMHRRNASERPSGRPSVDKVGSLETTTAGRQLPAMFKSPVAPRKSSPVGPLDAMYWGDDDTDAQQKAM